jgi:hypothetical protein
MYVNWVVRKRELEFFPIDNSPGFVVQTVRAARPFPVNYFTMCIIFKSQFKLTDLLREVAAS